MELKELAAKRDEAKEHLLFFILSVTKWLIVSVQLDIEEGGTDE